MPPPTNTTPETALDVGALPVAATQDLTGFTPTQVFYRYTAVAGDVALGGVGNQPVSVYSDTAFTHYLDLTFMAGRFQMPVVLGATYWFMLNVAAGTVASLTLERAPNVAVPAGSIAINDDAPGFPLAILSAVDGTVQQFRHPFPAGESGVALPDGRSLWEDAFAPAKTLGLYDHTLTAVTTVVWPWVGSGNIPVASNRLDRFYLGDPGVTTARVTTLSAAGVLGPTTWTLPGVGLWNIGVSPDEATLYYTSPDTDPTHLLRYDLGASSALAPLAARPAGYEAPFGTLLVLADGTILLGARRLAPLDGAVVHYGTDGAVLATYALGAVQLNRLTAALDDPLSFWAWSYLQGAAAGFSRFQRVRVSDGTVLVSFDAAQFEEGEAQPATPGTAYGHSLSCPFVVLPPALPPVGPPAPPEPPPPFVGAPPGAGTWGPPPTGPSTVPCVTPARPAAACWAPHDPAALAIGVITEGLP